MKCARRWGACCATAVCFFFPMGGAARAERSGSATGPASPASVLAPPDPSAAAGASYQPRDVGPVIEVTEADRKGHALMLRVLAALGQRESESNAYYGTFQVTEARRQYLEARTDDEKMMAGLRLAYAELDQADYPAALAQLASSERLLTKIEARLEPEIAAEFRFVCALVNLRYGETQNCCLMHNKDSCLLPIQGGGVHARQEGSRTAIAELAKVVKLVPPDSDRALDSAWLWNICAMTLGEHPQGVPQPFRIAPERYRSQEKFPRFMNVASELGLDMDSMCGCVIAEDFNNDGYLDLMVSTWDVREPLKLYVNDGAGKFVDRSSAAGLDGICGGLNMAQGDYNNDGRVDVYIPRGAWLGPAGRHVGSLLRNNGDGTFTDVTYAAGLGDESYPGLAVGWADYDLDGWLDLFVCGEEGPTNRAPCRLFHNNGDGTFADVAEQAGVATHQFAKGCSWGDYNNDRYPDLFVSNLLGPPGLGSADRLYRNNGDGTFTDVAREAGAADVGDTFPTWFWDYDNDGVLDLFVAMYNANTAQLARHYLGQPATTGMPHVLRGTPEGKFIDVTQQLGLDEPTLVMGCNFGDLDNDGWLDMYLGTGSPDYQMIIPNKMFHNIGGQRFSDVSEAAGMAHLQKGHGVAFADLDADGDQDVFIQMGGAYPVDKYVDALFENPGFGNHWLAVELVGVESNRLGVGSRIRVDVEEHGRTRSIYKWVNSGGSFGCNSLRQQIGVGNAATIKRLEVYWPKSDTTQTFENVAVDGIVRVTEGQAELSRIELRPATLAKAQPKLTMGPPLAPLVPGN